MLKHKYRVLEKQGVSTKKSAFFIQKQFYGLKIMPFLYIRDKHTRKKIYIKSYAEALSIAKRLAEKKKIILHEINM